MEATRQQIRATLRDISNFGCLYLAEKMPRKLRRELSRAYANAAYRAGRIMYAPDNHKYDHIILEQDIVRWCLREFTDLGKPTDAVLPTDQPEA